MQWMSLQYGEQASEGRCVCLVGHAVQVMHAAGGPEEVLEAAQEALNAVTVS
jgi:hypothetical protein